MNLIVVGTNHKHSAIELREKISFSKSKVRDALYFLKENYDLKGAIILSTCNRVEFYASVEDTEKGSLLLDDFISRYHEINKQEIAPYFYRYNNEQALRHLFSVACGLDSLILGETQILGQVKSALSDSEAITFVDAPLRKVFYSALYFAKRMHNETKLCEGKISAASVAIDFIKRKLGDISHKNILIIGVGKITELTLQYLNKEKLKVVFISNRSFEKAKDLARQISGEAVRFSELKEAFKKADVVISATASPHFVLKKEMLENLNDHPTLIVDLAMPRDVDPKVGQLANIELFDLENLGLIIQENLAKREIEAEKIREFINIEVEKLWTKFTESEPAKALSL